MLRRVASHLSAAPAAATVDTGVIPAADRSRFEEEGYCVLHGFLSAPRLAALRQSVEATIEAEGERSGWEQAGHFANKAKWGQHLRRACNLFSKGEPFVELATEPLLLAYAQLSMPTTAAPFHLGLITHGVPGVPKWEPLAPPSGPLEPSLDSLKPTENPPGTP
jgi:hypothetical protein